MNQQFRHRQFTSGNPLANALVVIAGILVISLSLALGIVVFVAIAGFVLIMAAIMGVRGWWLRRRFGSRAGPEIDTGDGQRPPPRVIEGEYYEVRPGKGRRNDS